MIKKGQKLGLKMGNFLNCT